MSDTTDKTCKCCGIALVRRPKEPPSEWSNRQTCSRLCGARAWRGIITNPNIVMTPDMAMRNIIAAMQGWRRAA
ncbi:hypothetical protein [Malikia spinosa]|uniref:hypothetical protein n=1 Tax=Malikia spinosa TaxID=86180 RepID=UPI002FD913F1